MRLSSILSQAWYSRDVVEVARDMLGMRLVRLLDDRRISGIIVEAEAYRGEEDLACHAKPGAPANRSCTVRQGALMFTHLACIGC